MWQIASIWGHRLHVLIWNYRFRSHIESPLNWNKFMHILIANDRKRRELRCYRVKDEKLRALGWQFQIQIKCCSFLRRGILLETWSWLCLMATHLALSFIYAVTSALSTRRVLYKSSDLIESFVRCVLYFLCNFSCQQQCRDWWKRRIVNTLTVRDSLSMSIVDYFLIPLPFCRACA